MESSALVGDEDGADDHVYLASRHCCNEAAELQLGKAHLSAQIRREPLR
jgi:hypothetical protein